MEKSEAQSYRELKTDELDADLVIVGGGLAGACAAITAARAGVQVVLIQDRPVLGGNASSEVRLWILGATSHMGNNNRWAREGGVIDELLVENMYRNPEGNTLILDTILLEMVVKNRNIRLLLNTAAFEVTKSGPDSVESVKAFCSQNSTMYQVRAPLFCDASGDGVLGFMAGAAFRMGAESTDEFGEGFAPSDEYGELLGHSLYFYTKDTGKPVRFVPPSYALGDITKIPRWRSFNTKEDGCRLWWIEYGGRLDTVHQTEEIKWELWKVVYGVWNYIKNSGQFPESETLTLEWVGQIPGKRESRRFEGDAMLIQQDIVEQREHYDAVSFGGWAVDLHPADGVFAKMPSCTQWHSKGVYQIPYRAMYSRNVNNLFLAGRIISASHVAFGSSRVMATCAHSAQAVGMAAAICKQRNWLPRDLAKPDRIVSLQRDLLRQGQHIPNVLIPDHEDLATSASITSSSTMQLTELSMGDEWASLEGARAMLIPVQEGTMPKLQFYARSSQETELKIQLRTCSREASFTPDEVLSEASIRLGGECETSRLHTNASYGASGGTATKASAASEAAVWQTIQVAFDETIEVPRYVMVCMLPNLDVNVALSDDRVTGVLALSQSGNLAVSKGAIQSPPENIGIDTFEFWLPERRPAGKNIAMKFDPPLQGFESGNVSHGPERPTSAVNAWVANADDQSPWIELAWDEPKTICKVIVSLDTDFDHPMESALMGHPESEMPFCASTVRLLDDGGNVLAERHCNHQTRCDFKFMPTTTKTLTVELHGSKEKLPVSVFRVRVFE